MVDVHNIYRVSQIPAGKITQAVLIFNQKIVLAERIAYLLGFHLTKIFGWQFDVVSLVFFAFIKIMETLYSRYIWMDIINKWVMIIFFIYMSGFYELVLVRVSTTLFVIVLYLQEGRNVYIYMFGG